MTKQLVLDGLFFIYITESRCPLTAARPVQEADCKVSRAGELYLGAHSVCTRHGCNCGWVPPDADPHAALCAAAPPVLPAGPAAQPHPPCRLL